MSAIVVNLLWVNVLIYYVEKFGEPGIKAKSKETTRDVRFNRAILMFIEGVTTSFFLLRILWNDMGIRLRTSPLCNNIMSYFFIAIRISVIAFCIFYLIPHWESIEERIFIFLEKDEIYESELFEKKAKAAHSAFN